MKRIWVLMLAAAPLLAQSNVAGNLPLTLVDGGADCGGLGWLVEVHADPTGLSGDGGAAAGINGFVLVLQASRNGVLTAVLPGSTPIGWQTRVTAPPLSNLVRVAGWSTDINAPNSSYHLVTLVLTGTQGPVTISLQPGTEVASRLVGPGNGPALMALNLPSPLSVSVPFNFDLVFLMGIAEWLQVAPDYDLTFPSGNVDVRDLIKLVTCTP